MHIRDPSLRQRNSAPDEYLTRKPDRGAEFLEDDVGGDLGDDYAGHHELVAEVDVVFGDV